MRYTVRLYASPEQEQRAEPVATVVLTDQRQQAGWLPERMVAEARLYLERIDTPDARVAQRVRAVLQQPRIRVSRASAHRAGAVRTRGDYTADAPYGAPAYWRVAIGRLQSQEGLRYDLQDYGRLLDAMEVAHGTAAVPVPAVADRSAVLRQCSLYLLRLGQEGWWAGTPTFDAAQQRWTVPVYATAGGEDVVTGEIVFDVRGQIEHVHLPDPEPVLSPQVGGVLGEAPGAPLAQRLAAALQWLADIRQELAPRLRAWGEQVARGATHAEAALHTVLAGRSPIIALIHDLSHPSVQVAYAGTGIRRRGGEPLPAGQDTNTVDITTDAMPNGARVTVDENTVRALFLDWQAPSPPLLVLVPDDPGRTPHVPDRVEGEGDTWTIRFTLVPPGAYLLAVAPPGV